MRRLSVVLGVVALLLLTGGPAYAVPPFRLADQVTDEVGALRGREDEVDEAVDELRRANGIQLFVVFAASFDGAEGADWASATAELSMVNGGW